MSSPAGELAKRITAKLIAEGLLTPGDEDRLLAKLAEGTLRPEDWKLAVDKNSDPVCHA